MFSPTAWAAASVRRPGAVIGAWIALFFVSIAVIVLALPSALTTSNGFVGTPESQRAADLITGPIGSQDQVVETVVVQLPKGARATDPSVVAGIKAVEAKILALGPKKVSGLVGIEAKPALVAPNGSTIRIPVLMAGSLDNARKSIPDLAKIIERADTRELNFGLVGTTSIEYDTQQVASSDLATGESIGIPIALIILLFVFGAVTSALLPLGMAIMAIVIALALTAGVGQVYQLSFFVTNMLTMMGLAVGIDYVLFVVSRYREERAAGVVKDAAILRAASTAGRAVLFSGITVVVALIGMLIVPTTIFVSLGVGAVLVVLVAVAASTTLLPAVLAKLGDRIEKGNIGRLIPGGRRESGRIWARIVTAVMKRPVISLVGTTALLVAAAIPYGTISTGFAGLATMPKDMPSRQAAEVLQRDFGVGGTSPAVIPIVGDPNSPANQATIAKITAGVAGDGTLGTPVMRNGSSAKGGILEVPVNADALSKTAEDAVTRIRGLTDLPVGGQTAQNLDFFEITNRYLPIVIGLVLGLSFLVLLLAFRSIVVPLVAIAMNLLSVGAAFGLLTLVSQHGYGANLLGFQQVETVEAWIPLFLFSVLFGLSMDYHVFLLSRIKERFDLGATNAESITHGVSSSARLITGAALIMVAVFGGFASGNLVMFQQMGFGLGVAVLIDATLVRGIMVPAAMKLIGGKANWYLPKALSWLPKISIEAPNTSRAR